MKKSLITLLILTSQLRIAESEVVFFEVETEKHQERNRLNEAIEVIKEFETLSIKPIRDKNLFYVGYGCITQDSVSSVTEQQADSLLLAVMAVNRSYLSVECDSNKRFFDLALVLAFNIGHGRVLKSKFWQLVKNNGSSKQIENEYLEFRLVEGKPHAKMMLRRKKEFNIYK